MLVLIVDLDDVVKHLIAISLVAFEPGFDVNWFLISSLLSHRGCLSAFKEVANFLICPQSLNAGKVSILIISDNYKLKVIIAQKVLSYLVRFGKRVNVLSDSPPTELKGILENSVYEGILRSMR